MRVIILLVASLSMAAGLVLAATYVPRTEMMLLFDASPQKHPKTAVVAIPIMGPVVGVDGGPLGFSSQYITYFHSGEDPRNSKGKVTMKIEVVRDDQVIWKRTKKSRVKYDRHTGWQCGNCTHKLNFYNKFDGSLQKGDLVLFHFTFKGLPRFVAGESAAITVETYRE